MPTSMQIGSLNAEILHNLSTIADDADMLNRVAKYLRRLVKKREDETLMTREEFLGKLDEAEETVAAVRELDPYNFDLFVFDEILAHRRQLFFRALFGHGDNFIQNSGIQNLRHETGTYNSILHRFTHVIGKQYSFHSALFF